MKRYCQTLTLKEDPELIEAYCREHGNVWPEIQEGIRSVGILDMQRGQIPMPGRMRNGI